MAYPSLEELLKAYQTQNPGAGPVIQAGTQGVEQGANITSSIAQRQALDAYRQQTLGERIREAVTKEGQGAEKLAQGQEKLNKPSKQYQVAPGITAPEGKVAVMDQTTGKIEYQDLPGANSGKDVTSGIADARIKMSLSNQLLQDPQYRKNQDIIDRGLRVDNISSAKDIVDNPSALHILNDLIVAQAEGGKASLAGVAKVGNETAQQFASRVLEKITNEPESANANAFIKQLKSISHQDMKSAYTSIKSLAKAKANGLQRIYPGKEKVISDTADNFADDYVSGLYQGKKPQFLSEPTGGIESTSTTSTETPKNANDFLKKHGLIK